MRIRGGVAKRAPSREAPAAGRGGLSLVARVAFLVVFVYLIAGLCFQIVEVLQMRRLVLGLEDQVAALRAENQRLAQDIEFARTDEYIKQVAREELGLVWPDEIPYARGVRLGP
jgi:cell division protein FtsB